MKKVSAVHVEDAYLALHAEDPDAYHLLHGRPQGGEDGDEPRRRVGVGGVGQGDDLALSRGEVQVSDRAVDGRPWQLASGAVRQVFHATDDAGIVDGAAAEEEGVAHASGKEAVKIPCFFQDKTSASQLYASQ